MKRNTARLPALLVHWSPQFGPLEVGRPSANAADARVEQGASLKSTLAAGQVPWMEGSREIET